MKLVDFYILNTNYKRYPVGVSHESMDWDLCQQLVKGDYSAVTFPVIFRQCSGRKWTDILSPSSVSLYVVSRRLLDLLVDHEITGWKSYPVVVYDKTGVEVEGYAGLSIVGRSGPVDLSKSDIIQKKLIQDGPIGDFYRGMYLDSREWDGTDMFIPEGTLYIIVSAKVREVVLKNRITNVELCSLDDRELLKV